MVTKNLVVKCFPPIGLVHNILISIKSQTIKVVVFVVIAVVFVGGVGVVVLGLLVVVLGLVVVVVIILIVCPRNLTLKFVQN